MEFKAAIEAAEHWVANGKSGFTLLTALVEERQLVFEQHGISFYVVCPVDKKTESEQQTNWHVWSDNAEVLTRLDDVQEFLSSCRKKTLVEVLNKVYEAVKPLLGACGDPVAGAALDSDDEAVGDGGSDIDEGYYMGDDPDLEADFKETNIQESDDDDVDPVNHLPPAGSNAQAVSRIIKDMKSMQKANGQFGIKGEPRCDNLFLWDVQLIDIPTDTKLGQDLRNYSRKYKQEPWIQLEMKFPTEYPFAPPFVRVVRPRFQFLTGHITIGGSICMEMLTKSGWVPSNDIEGILVQIRTEILSDPNVRLDPNSPNRPYDQVEAKTAFDRMVQKYGWNK